MVSLGFKDINEMNEYMLVLVNLMDMRGLLKKSPCFSIRCRDNVHVLFSHFLDLNCWMYYGSPRHISSSARESEA